MSSRTRLRFVPFLLVVAVASACGSTVQVTSTTGAGGSGGGDGLGGPGLSGTPQTNGPGLGGRGGSTGGTTGLGGGTTGLGGGAAGSGGTTGSATGVTTSGTTGGPGPAAPGVTAKEIYVGLVYDPNAGSLNKATGASGVDSGDSKDDEIAVIDDINKHGGVAGRKLVPVFARFDSTSTQTLDQQYKAICDQFTHDQPRVFAVTEALLESYRECLSKAGVAMLDDDLPRFGQAELDRYPSLIEMGFPNLDRLASYQVTPLAGQHYFTPWNTMTGQPAAAGAVKVGILTFNDIYFAKAVDHYLVPALKRLGYDPVVERINQLSTASDTGALSASVSSAELKFASSGVTHVLPFETGGSLSEFFVADARSQRYYPRYGINSGSAFQVLLSAGLLDKSQAMGAVGFGWLPNLDVANQYNPESGPYSNATRRRCATVMRSHAIAFKSSNSQGIGFIACTTLYLLKAALDKTPAPITLSTFIRSVESLGSAFQPAGGLGPLGVAFKPGRRDPSNKAYQLAYFANCGCFHYAGTIQTVP